MAVSIFKWTGLPQTIDTRFLELTVIESGLNVFFYDDDIGSFLSLRATQQGKYDVYNNPLGFIANGASGGYKKYLKNYECVPIWNNPLRTSDLEAIEIYARRLADVDRTVDVNLMAQKMPVFIAVPETQRLTVENMVKQWLGNEPIVVASSSGTLDLSAAMEYLSPNTPFISDKLLDVKMTIWSEAMTYFGVDNQNIEKAERVQSSEVNANNGQIEANRLIRLNCRRRSCKQINEYYIPYINDRYGTDFDFEVDCNFNHDLATENYDKRHSAPDYFDSNDNGSGGLNSGI